MTYEEAKLRQRLIKQYGSPWLHIVKWIQVVLIIGFLPALISVYSVPYYGVWLFVGLVVSLLVCSAIYAHYWFKMIWKIRDGEGPALALLVNKDE